MQVNKRKGKFTFILVACLFILPVLIAYGLFFSGAVLGGKTTNNGTLIRPPLQLSQLSLQKTNGYDFDKKSLHGKWVLLYVNPDGCHKLCETNLYNIRQIRRATGQDMTRIKRIVLTFAGESRDVTLAKLQKQYPDMLHLVTEKTQFAMFVNKLPAKQTALTTGYLFIVDPNGNVMMGYNPDAKAKGILKDLQRLLKVSQIG